MGPANVIRLLTAIVPTRRATYLWGPPGVGKTDCVRQVAKNLGLDMIDLRAVLLDPVDLRGLPTIKKGTKGNADTAEWCAPSFLPLKGKVKGPGLIFADELAQAAPLVQAAFLQGILDHRIGEAELDPSWAWVAASNRQEDRAGAHRLISPLLNRFIHIDLEVSGEEWQTWAITAGIAAEVRNFLKFKSTMLHSFDPSNNERAFPTPRSWAFVSEILSVTPSDLLFHAVQGCVGKGAAAEFVGFMKTWRELPDLDEVLKAPESWPIPAKEPSVCYALVGSITERAAKAQGDMLNRLMTYGLRMSGEFAGMLFRDAIVVNKGVVRCEAAMKWCSKNPGLFIDM